MSADSQRRSASSSATAAAARCMPAIVPPQAVSDRSIIDSVAGFINDVTLQTQTPQGDGKDHILWARFESTADISDPCLGDDWELEGGIAPPLLLILGYINGIQVWIIPANGEAIEVLSWRHGSVKCLRVLPTPTFGDGESATEPNDQFIHKRPLIALCDSASSGVVGSSGGMSSGNQSQYCSINFISLKDGENVKSIKFKNPIVDILANRSSVVVSFAERIAIFDARTLEDRLTVTTCHPSPGLNPNPIALGPRWIAYAEKKLLPSKRSSGGCDGDGVTSYTATVLNAAKSLGKGLRELGEQMAAGLTGGSHSGPSSISGLSGCGSTGNVASEGNQPGIVTILDIKYPIKDVSPTTGTPIASNGNDPMVAHFVAHSEAIVALQFDASGMLLLTADKRGHDFHVFRIHPHPSGPSLAAVHHLYILHRGDTTAKVQDIAFSLDSRWVAISTLRGTTHVFPVTPYGGPAGVRTHGSPHVVNRLSRFHRSAGLSIDGRSSSPVSHMEHPASQTPTSAYANPRIPPFPHPTIVQPLAQLRQPSSLGTQSNSSTNVKSSTGSGRQRNSSSSSDDLVKPLRVCATFAKARSWLLDPPGSARDTPAHRIQRKPVDSLFIIAAHGALIQYDLEPKHTTNIPKEKVCDDTPIELEVEAKAQWTLQRQESATANDIQPPLPLDNWLVKDRFLEEVVGDVVSDYGSFDHHHRGGSDHRGSTSSIDHDDRWLSQVEIITHAGPHRRLWMGPQFMFKTYNTPSGSPLTSIDTDSVEIGPGNMVNRPARSNPMNMPISGGMRPLVPILIESGSCSYEQSPRMINMPDFRHQENLDTEFSSLGPVESQLREDLADAMRESPLISGRDTTGYASATPIPAGLSSVSSCSSTSIYSSTHSLNSICDQKLSLPVVAAGAPSHGQLLKHHVSHLQHQQQQQHDQHHSSSLPTICSRPASAASSRASGSMTITKVVNPLGTVTTVCNVESDGAESGSDPLGVRDCDVYMHENCDEALFRPVVTVHGIPGGQHERRGSSLDRLSSLVAGGEEPASLISRELIVPVIEKKNMVYFSKAKKKEEENLVAKFEELSSINKKSKKDEPKVIEVIPEATDRKMSGDFVDVEIVERKPEAPKAGRKKEKSPPVSARNERKKKDPEPIEVIEIIDPVGEELHLPAVEKVPRGGKKKDNGKKKEEPKQQQQQPTTKAETKPLKGAAGNGGGQTGGSNRKETKQDNRKRKEKYQAPVTPPETVPEPELREAAPIEDDMLKSICDEFPPLEALKIDDLELFGESNEPENLKVTRTEISVQESMLASSLVGNRDDDEPVKSDDAEASSHVHEDDAGSSVVEENKCVELVKEEETKAVKEEEFYEISTRYELEFPEPLPPLEPLICKDLEDLGFSESEKKEQFLKQLSEEKTLINFESPLEETAKESVSERGKSILEGRNIVFAMCSSLKEMGESSGSQLLGGTRSLSTSMMEPAVLKQQLSVEGQDSDYKSLELEVDDSAMYSSQLPASSASDDDTSNSNNDEPEDEVKQNGKLPPQGEDEDEELQPLISSNKTSSSSLSATVVSTVVGGGGPGDSLSSSMTTSGFVAAAGSPAKTSTTTSALPTTEANQSEDSGKQMATTAKQSSNGGNNGNNGNGKKKSKKKRK
ncbi:breast carcinoma-amplified sequence 3 homolog isoform X2 [Ochlerotatus camptorhynchus]|uniref:breast carcinoma-amplified sequence 3 homolog isoform X2 n=1 Tax=Ochlerotatus camptorhynchus TaxID=644619 RepID=UPI0031E382BB